MFLTMHKYQKVIFFLVLFFHYEGAGWSHLLKLLFKMPSWRIHTQTMPQGDTCMEDGENYSWGLLPVISIDTSVKEAK